MHLDLTQLVSHHLHHMIWLTTMHSLPPFIVHLIFIKRYLTLLSVSLHMTFLLCKVYQFLLFMKIKYMFIFMMILLKSVVITLADDDYIDEDVMSSCAMIVPPPPPPPPPPQILRSMHTHRVAPLLLTATNSPISYTNGLKGSSCNSFQY